MNAHSRAMQMHAHSVQMAHHANQQAMHDAAQARHMAAMAASQSRRMAAMSRRGAAVAPSQSVRNTAILKQRELIASLMAATERPLDCSPSYHSNGATSLLLGKNWTDAEGGDHVVLLCNTKLPGSGRPAAVFLLTEHGINWVDLIDPGLSELVKRGRLFIYTGRNIGEGEKAFAILHATFEDARGSVGHWSFATAGAFRGKPFVVGTSAFGGFLDPKYRDVMVARPLNYSSAVKQWIWYGSSSVREDERLILRATMPFDAGNASIRFAVPASGNGNVAALRCTQRDDRGDPIAVFDSRADAKHIIKRFGDRLYLLCPANRKLPSGEAVFIAPTRAATDGTMVFAGSGPWKGSEIRFEIEANHNVHGQHIFLIKAKAFLGSRKVAAIPLRSIASFESGS